jgi:hypothetical protein
MNVARFAVDAVLGDERAMKLLALNDTTHN